MTVHPDDELTRRPANARVQTRSDVSAGVFKDCQIKPTAVGEIYQLLGRSVYRASVCDKYLDVTIEVLFSEIGDEALKVLGLVQHRGDDRDAVHVIAVGVLQARESGRLCAASRGCPL